MACDLPHSLFRSRVHPRSDEVDLINERAGNRRRERNREIGGEKGKNRDRKPGKRDGFPQSKRTKFDVRQRHVSSDALRFHGVTTGERCFPVEW